MFGTGSLFSSPAGEGDVADQAVAKRCESDWNAADQPDLPGIHRAELADPIESKDEKENAAKDRPNDHAVK